MDWKKIGKKILYPHPEVLAALSLLSAGLLTYSFACLDSADAVSIVSYVLSFYALTVLCLRVPAIVSWIQRFRRENPYYRRYAGDIRLKMNVSLQGGFSMNAVYALFQLGLGVLHRSVWFYAMAAYYLLLAGMRLLLLHYTRRHAPGEQQEGEWRRYRLCGAMMLVMNFALAIILIYFVYRLRTFKHYEITTIAMAAYTFASLASAIWNFIRYKHCGSPVYSAAKAISLVAAAVSMLTLENAMLTAFGEENSELFRQIMLGSSGAAVILFVQGIAIYMIVRAGRNLRGKRFRA